MKPRFRGASDRSPGRKPGGKGMRVRDRAPAGRLSRTDRSETCLASHFARPGCAPRTMLQSPPAGAPCCWRQLFPRLAPGATIVSPSRLRLWATAGRPGFMPPDGGNTTLAHGVSHGTTCNVMNEAPPVRHTGDYPRFAVDEPQKCRFGRSGLAFCI